MSTQSATRHSGAYLMFGANGKTMVPIQTTGLKLGQVVSYGDMANPDQKAVVTSEQGEMYGQPCIFVDDLHQGEVSVTTIEGPGGWRLEADEPLWSPEEVADLVRRATEKQDAKAQAREAQEKEHARLLELGQKMVEANKPAWAVAAIIAEQERDTSDMMSDYHGSTTERTVFLTWSKHERDVFSEMRKAAALFPDTAHLGPGRDIYTAHVVYAKDHQDAGGFYFEGNSSRGHDELYPSGFSNEPPTFQTQAEAEAFVSASPKPYDVRCRDHGIATFTWRIDKTPVEHREKWSMGHGYYLAGKGGQYSGWQVRKVSGRYFADTIAMCFATGNVAGARFGLNVYR